MPVDENARQSQAEPERDAQLAVGSSEITNHFHLKFAA
jgi:hypothetical protein